MQNVRRNALLQKLAILAVICLCLLAFAVLGAGAQEPEADLQVSKFVMGSPNIQVGQVFTYTIFVDNLGPSAASNVVVSDTLLNSGSVSIQSCAFSVSQGGGSITQFTCTTGEVVSTQFGSDIGTFSTNLLDPLTPGSQGRLRASFRVVANQAVDVINTTRVVADTPDPNMSNNMATSVFRVEELADLQVSKFVMGSPNIQVGQVFTYTIYVDNLGPAAARNVVVSDTLLNSGSVTIQSCAFSVSQGGGLNTQLTCATGEIVSTQFGSDIGTFSTNRLDPLTPGTQGRLRASFTVMANQAVNVINTTRVVADTPDPNMSNNMATSVFSVEELADLQVSKFVMGSPNIQVGQVFTYTIFVDNLGPAAARNVVVSDTLLNSGSVTIQSCAFSVSQGGGAITQFTCTTGEIVSTQFGSDIGTFSTNLLDPLTPGTQGRLRASFRVVANQAVDVINTTRVVADTPDPNMSNNMATSVFSVEELADLQVSKFVVGSPNIQAGQTFTYTIFVDNLGPAAARNVVVSDTLLNSGSVSIQSCAFSVSQGGGAITQFTCTTGEIVSTQFGSDIGTFSTNLLSPLTPGTQGRLRASFRMVANQAVDVINTTRVVADTPDPDMSNNMATSVFRVEELADLAVFKVSKPDHTVRAGQNFTYTIFVDNLGPASARNVRISDATVGSDDFWVVTVLDDPARDDSCVSNPGLGVSTQSSSILCSLVNPLEPLGAAGAPGTGRWTVTAVLRSNVDVDVDNLVRVYTGVNASGQSGTPDPDMSNNEAADFISVEAVADLVVSKVDDPDPVQAGGVLTYLITVRNGGPSPAENVVVRDNLPDEVTVREVSEPGMERLLTAGPIGRPVVAKVVSVTGVGPLTAPSCAAGTPGDPNDPTTCTFGTLPPGEEGTMEIVVQVRPDVLPPGAGLILIQNDVTVTSDQLDPDRSSNSFTATTMVVPGALLLIEKSVQPEQVERAGSFDVTIVVTNLGPAVARDVQIRDLLLGQSQYLALESWDVQAGRGECSYVNFGTSEVRCTLDEMLPGEARWIDLRMRLDDRLACGLFPDQVVINGTLNPSLSIHPDSVVTATVSLNSCESQVHAPFVVKQSE